MSPARRVARWAGTLALIVLVAAAASSVTGGPFQVVVVAGDSMLPTYQSGDLLLTWTHSNAEAGDIIVYDVAGDSAAAGHKVVHRVVAPTDTGGYITRGDNNDSDDPWEPTDADITGQPFLHIPHGSIAIRLLRSTWIFGLAIAALVTALLWPRNPADPEPSDSAPGDDDTDGHGDDPDADTTPEPDSATEPAGTN